MLKLFQSSSEIFVSPEGFLSHTVPAKWRLPTKPLVTFEHASPLSIDDESLNQLWNILFSQEQKVDRFLDIIIADVWVRYFMVTPLSNAERLQDYQAAGQMRFETLYGESSEAWNIQSDWQLEMPSLACAVPKSLLVKLEEVTRSHQQIILSIQPNFIREWNIWRKKIQIGAWFAVVSHQTLILAIIHDQQLYMVRTTRLSDVVDDGWLQTHIIKEAMVLNFPIPVGIQLVGDVRKCCGATVNASSHYIAIEMAPDLSNLGHSPSQIQINSIKEHVA